jgi:hypothetical protein
MVKRTIFLILKYPQDPIIKRENNYQYYRKFLYYKTKMLCNYVINIIKLFIFYYLFL